MAIFAPDERPPSSATLKHLIHIDNIKLQDFPFTKGNLQDRVHHGDSYGVSHSLALEGVVCFLRSITIYIFLL